MILESFYGVVAIRVTTGVPCPTGAETISVDIESLMLVVTAAGASVRRLKVHTLFDVAGLAVAARTNSVGAEMVADTVCPTSTFRAMTTPSIGDSTIVFERLSSALSTAERACRMIASALATCAVAERLLVSAVWSQVRRNCDSSLMC
jgi:hypothetical protein